MKVEGTKDNDSLNYANKTEEIFNYCPLYFKEINSVGSKLQQEYAMVYLGVITNIVNQMIYMKGCPEDILLKTIHLARRRRQKHSFSFTLLIYALT